jgi:hypothetical protein
MYDYLRSRLDLKMINILGKALEQSLWIMHVCVMSWATALCLILKTFKLMFC